MAQRNSPPPLDARTEQDIIDQTTDLATYYTATPGSPGWSSQRDLGAALVRVFARMMGHAIARLNQVPEKNHLAFLDLLGARRLPPRPARAPLTFAMIEGADAEPVVPAGTPVAAASDEAVPEAVFTTETELVLTSARLAAVFAHRPADDLFADGTAIAIAGEAPGAFVAFAGTRTPRPDQVVAPLPIATPVPHRLFVADPILALRRGSAVVTFTLKLQTGRVQDDVLNALLRWEHVQNGTFVARPLSVVTPSGSPTSWDLSFTIPALPSGSSRVDGRDAPWLRATWLLPIPSASSGGAPPLPAAWMQNLTATVTVPFSPPDHALFNAAALDLTKDVLPFGERPRLGDAILFAHADVVLPHGTVTVRAVKSDDPPPPSGSNPLPLSLTVTWEVWDGTRWSPITPTAGDPNTVLVAGGDLVFTLGNVGPTAVNGIDGAWLRARISAPVAVTADFTNLPYRAYLPPSLKSLTLGATHTRALTSGLIQNGFSYLPWQSTTTPPFAAIAEDRTALYLGFDQPFAARSTTIYLQVDPATPDEVAPLADDVPPPAAAPRVVWEYVGAGSHWTMLGVDDETRVLSRSGLLRFVGPSDFQPSAAFGQERYWIRARLVDGTFDRQRRLRRVSPNTVWASHAATTIDEILGSSNGSADQRFTLSQTPVVLGQRIEVDEGQPPPADELAALTALEGADAMTVIPAERGNPQQVWVRWHEVSDFYGSRSTDRHYLFDHLTGTVTFGNGISGRIPKVGTQNIRAAWYQSGGGAAGNRSAGAISQPRTALPFIESVRNNEAAAGGTDAESLARVKERSSRTLRHGGRAVAAQDYEDLAFEASASVARATAVTPTFDPAEQAGHASSPTPEGVLSAGKVLVVVVPSSAADKPAPSAELLSEVHDYVAARCAPAVELQVTGPVWAEVQVQTEIAVSSLGSSERVLANVRATIHRFLHPLLGGPDGTGWAFGQQPQPSDLYLELSRVQGIDHIQSLAVTCTPPLEFDRDDPQSDDPQHAKKRAAAMSLIYSAGNHTITQSAATGARR
jgi:hypothetical protein